MTQLRQRRVSSVSAARSVDEPYNRPTVRPSNDRPGHIRIAPFDPVAVVAFLER